MSKTILDQAEIVGQRCMDQRRVTDGLPQFMNEFLNEVEELVSMVKKEHGRSCSNCGNRRRCNSTMQQVCLGSGRDSWVEQKEGEGQCQTQD